MGAWVVVLFAILPLQPVWFAGMVSVIGVAALVLRREQPHLVVVLLIFATFGAASQLLGPKDFGVSGIILPPQAEGSSSRSPNLIPFHGIYDLHGWNSIDGSGPRATLQPDGFRRVTRKNPVSGRLHTEILSQQTYQLSPGHLYTQSFYFQHDGEEIGFSFLFTTPRGQFEVPARLINYPDGLKRAYAVYKAQPGDTSLRAIDIYNLRGDWTYVDVAFAQLEIGSDPTPYSYKVTNQTGQVQGAIWWISTALISGLVFVGSRFVLHYISGIWVASAVGLGLLINLSIGLFQTLVDPTVERVSGLTQNPNLYGAGAVMSAALVVLMGNVPLSLLAIGASLISVVISGSRAALLGLLGLLPLLLFCLAVRWRRPVGLLMIFGVIFAISVGIPDYIGRSGSVTDLNHVDNESRVEIWQVAWKAFMTHPLTGIGVNGFSNYYLEFQPDNAFDPLASHPHNLWLGLLAGSGLLGLAGFLTLWCTLLRRLWQRGSWSVLVLVSIALLMNLPDYTWFTAAVHYPLWFAVAWGLNTPHQPDALTPGTIRE